MCDSIFGPPLCLYLRPYVQGRSQTVHSNFLIFVKLGLPNTMEVTFSNFAQNYASAILALLGHEIALFGQKSKFWTVSQNLIIGIFMNLTQLMMKRLLKLIDNNSKKIIYVCRVENYSSLKYI